MSARSFHNVSIGSAVALKFLPESFAWRQEFRTARRGYRDRSARQGLFYATLDGHIMVGPYGVEGDTFRPDKPSLWSDTPFTPGQFRRYTLDPKRDRFAVGKRLEEEHRGTVVFLVNFFDELRRLVPITQRLN